MTSSPASRARRRLPPVVAGLVCALVLAGCSGDGGEEADSPEPTATPAATAAETEAATVDTSQFELPEGVTPTAEGSALEVGDTATVVWEPRAGLVGALELTVDVVAEARIRDFAGWQLDRATRQSTPYFIISTVRNAGDVDLGRVTVPLFVGDAADLLIQPSEFRDERFRPCPSESLPEPFEPGDEITVCQVFLVPDGGELQTVTFRPTQEFDPITWTGEPRAWRRVPDRVKRAPLRELREREQPEERPNRRRDAGQDGDEQEPEQESGETADPPEDE